MDKLRAALEAGRFDDVLSRARRWLVADAPRLLAGRLAEDEFEDLIQSFLAELCKRGERFWRVAIEAHAHPDAVRAYVRRAFLRFALRRLEVSVAEAGVLRRQTCRLLAAAPPDRFSRHELPEGRAFGLPSWGPRPVFTAPWAAVLDRVAADHAPYLRRRRHQGTCTWQGDDILDGCGRLLRICRRLARALHLARGLLRSGWFHVVDLFSPVPVELLDVGSSTDMPSLEVVAEVDTFVDRLSPPMREALWCYVNRYNDLPDAGWTALAISRREHTSREAVYRRCRQVERALREFLADLEATDRLLAIEYLCHRFEAAGATARGEDEPGEESSGAAA